MRALLLAPLLLLQLACAGRATPSMRLSSEPRGTDLALLPVSIALLSESGMLSVQLARPTYLTLFEQTAQGDSLRVIYATNLDTTGVLDGTVTLQTGAAVRQLLASDPQASLVRESCVVVERGAGDRGVPMCGTNGTPTSARARVPAAQWRFARPVILLATAEPYRGAEQIALAWFSRVDGEPPGVSGGWGAMPLGPSLPVSRTPTHDR